MQNLLAMLIPELRQELAGRRDLEALQEIRLRLGQMVCLVLAAGEEVLSLVWDEEMQRRQMMMFTESSLYAFDEQVKQGFIALSGGHRVGLCGVAWYDDDKLGGFRDIGSMNVRVAREVRGVARPFLPYVVEGGRVRRTLIAAGPRVGKTTLLRDLARVLSEGSAGMAAQNVGIADERQELAAVYRGRAMLNVGARCDVISGCAKARALTMLLRSMSPDVLITDEIGSAEDVVALQDSLNSGVAVLASAHAADYAELLSRPNVGGLLLGGYFERVIFPRRQGSQIVPQAVYDEAGERLL